VFPFSLDFAIATKVAVAAAVMSGSVAGLDMDKDGYLC